MSAGDSFCVYLHSLPARYIGRRVLGDGRHVLQITDDVSLYVRPDDDRAPIIEGLRKLAATATEMATALGEPPAAEVTQ